MSALGRFITAHRWLVALAWLAVLAAALAGAGHVGGRLSQQFSLPGQPGYEANQRILRAYHNGGQSAPLVPVITLPAGTTVDSPGVRATVVRALLVPALMSLLGPWNWWLPGWVARLLLVRPRAAQISAVRPSLTTRQAP